VVRGGERVTTEHFIVLLMRRDSTVQDTPPRLGVTVSRRVGSAVTRNRVKRGIREWFRRNQALLAPFAVLVVIARQGAAGLATKEISRELCGVVR
jgi:ribonuclease P protein component